MKRIVLDTNVIISAIFWKGYPKIIYELVQNKKFILLYSLEIERELIRVLAYPKFGLIPNEMLPILNNLRKNVTFVQVKSKIDIIKKDPTDNIILECAIDGKSDYIISGDKHLLSLKEYQGIIILNSADFLYYNDITL